MSRPDSPSVAQNPPGRQGLDAARLREDFPILGQLLHKDQPLAYLDNAASTQRPQAVIQAITDVYEQTYSNVHRGIHWLSERCTDQYEQAREKVQAFINAEHAAECIFTPGTTAGINAVARSWGDANIGEGDEIIVSVMEHHSNLVPWQQLAERSGAVLRHIPITDDGLLVLDELDKLLSARTRLVAIVAVSNVLGTINPIAEITRRAHQVGAVVLVDAAQQVPHMQIDVQQSDVDFLAFSGHKMVGPSGVGILYGKLPLLEAMPPFLGGGSMISDVQLDHFQPAAPPAKFEAGTPPIAQAIGLAAAIDYLGEIGLDAIHEHELQITRYAHDVLEEIEGLHLIGPDPEHKAGIVSFVMDDVQAFDLSQILDRHGVAVRSGHHCTQPLHARLGFPASVRASFYLYNTPADVDQLAEGIRAAQRFFLR